MFDKPTLQKSNPYKQIGSENTNSRTIYYGEVLSVDDKTDGGAIKVKIKDFDSKIALIDDIPWAYPLLAKYIHIIPQVGEMVWVLIDDIKYPQRSRRWMGSIISQPHKIGFDSSITALSTTNLGLTAPEKAPSTYPDAKGVFPTNKDIAIVGRLNTDIILSPNSINIRTGKHENDDILKLNKKNPAQISLNFEQNTNSDGNYESNTIISADKIALISHTGEPKFKAANLTGDDRKNIFENAHPIARGDVLIEALKIFREALITHIHGYSNLPVDKTAIIKSLEEINFEQILQKNIVVN